MEKEPSINTVVERLFLMNSNLKSFIRNEANSITGRKFAKELVKNLDKRFPDCGSALEEKQFFQLLGSKIEGVSSETVLKI